MLLPALLGSVLGLARAGTPPAAEREHSTEVAVEAVYCPSQAFE